MEKFIDYTSFIGGEADDLYKGPENSFYEAENIEVRKDLGGFKLSSLPIDTGFTFDSTITYMKHTDELGIPGGLITCLSNGKIYLYSTGMTTLATGTTAWDQVIGIGSGRVSGVTYIYYITRNDSGTVKIHRSNASLGTFNISHKEFTVGVGGDTTTKAYTINNNNLLYIATRNKVVTLDLSTELVEDALILPTDEEIKGFTFFQDAYTIYTNKGNSGKQYKWDGNDTLPYYSQEWINLPIQDVVNDGAYDYAILGFNENYSDLYRISGTQKQELRVNLEESIITRVFGAFISIRSGIIYISGGKSGQSSNYGIYTYGSYFPGTPQSLIQSYTGTTYKYKFHSHSTTLSYFSDENNKVWKVDFANPPAFGYADGYLVTRIEQGNPWEEKQFKKAKIGYKLETGSEIKIYVRTDFSNSWSLLKTLDYATYGTKKRTTINTNEINALNLGNFTEIQFKFLLTAGTSDDYTPIIKRFTAILDTVKED